MCRDIQRQFKKLILLVLIATAFFSLAACDSGLQYISIEITQLPNQTEYDVGSENELLLTGGEVILTTADGHTLVRRMSEYTFAEEGQHGIYTDANFQEPGTYKVIITQCKNVQCVFYITVSGR